LASETYRDNFHDVRIYQERCERLSPHQVKRAVGPIDLLIASPECTSHTCARGNGRRSEKSRETALQVVRFARVLQPRWIIVENVTHMRQWRRYRAWLAQLTELGYEYREQVLNAAEFGVPQSRKRLFIVFDRQGSPPEVTPGRQRKSVPAQRIIESNGTYSYSRLDLETRAPATLERAERAMTALRGRRSFLLVYYGSDGGGGWQRVDTPLRTVTTLDRFAYVRPRNRGYEMRMLQVPELQRAMGFPKDFRLKHGVRRDKIKLLGNAVCPPVMKAIVAALLRRRKTARQNRSGGNGR
jgi:DNA (cytosine-5)-methyltransferase 1